jgi:CBS domain-containing protein
VAKGPRRAGLVFQALHHAPDAHAALATLLDHNFDDLVIVEPLTNRLFGVLARFDLVQRVEYTGTRPDWLDLRRITEIATTRGYAVSSNTWWEIPPYFSRDWLNARPALWHGFYQLVDGFSRTTNLVRFGSMAAVHLARS